MGVGSLAGSLTLAFMRQRRAIPLILVAIAVIVWALRRPPLASGTPAKA